MIKPIIYLYFISNMLAVRKFSLHEPFSHYQRCLTSLPADAIVSSAQAPTPSVGTITLPSPC